MTEKTGDGGGNRDRWETDRGHRGEQTGGRQGTEGETETGGRQGTEGETDRWETDRGQKGKQRQVEDRQLDREDRGWRGKQRQVGDRQGTEGETDRWERGTQRNASDRQGPGGAGGGGEQTRGETEMGGGQPVKERNTAKRQGVGNR